MAAEKIKIENKLDNVERILQQTTERMKVVEAETGMLREERNAAKTELTRITEQKSSADEMVRKLKQQLKSGEENEGRKYDESSAAMEQMQQVTGVPLSDTRLMINYVQQLHHGQATISQLEAQAAGTQVKTAAGTVRLHVNT